LEVVAGAHQERAGLGGQLDAQAPLGQARTQPVELDFDDLLELGFPLAIGRR